MAEVLHDYGLVESQSGAIYHVRACGGPLDGTVWQGWLEFEPVDGGETLRSPRETTQPNQVDLVYWASGLSAVYIEGSLNRALNPLVRPVACRASFTLASTASAPLFEKKKLSSAGGTTCRSASTSSSMGRWYTMFA